MSDRLRGRTILVVDDEPELRVLTAEELRDRGCLVLEAASGREALALVAARPVDAVVSDVRMPGGTGLELLDGIQRRPSPRPPVVLMTGFSDVVVWDALARGAVAVLGKPYDPDELAEILARALGPVIRGACASPP